MSTQGDKLKAIADAIRAKEGSSDPIPANDFPARIAAIQTGTDTSDATATAGDILAGKTAYGASGKLTGTIPSKGESDLSVSGPTVTVPSGYYPAQVSKSVAAAEQATPAISVSSGGLITATAQQTEGYVPAGSKSATQQLTVQGAQTITPGTTAKTIPAGLYLTGAQTIQGDANLKEENIRSGVSIFGKAGTYQGVSLKTATVQIKFTGITGKAHILYTGLDSDGQLVQNSYRNVETTDKTIYPVIGTVVVIGNMDERLANFFDEDITCNTGSGMDTIFSATGAIACVVHKDGEINIYVQKS